MSGYDKSQSILDETIITTLKSLVELLESRSRMMKSPSSTTTGKKPNDAGQLSLLEEDERSSDL